MDNKKIAQRHQEDVALVRGLFWLVGSAVLELLMILVNRYYINFTTSQESIQMANAVYTALVWLRIVGIVAMLAFILFSLVQLKYKKMPTHCHIYLFAFLATLTLCSHFTVTFGSAGVQMLLVLVPALGGLALAFFLYPHDFFCSASVIGMSAVAVWSLRYMSDTTALTIYLNIAKLAVVAGLFCYLINKTKKNNGSLTIKGYTVQPFGANPSYNVMRLSALVSVSAVLAALILDNMLVFYLIVGLIAWLFGLLVYYTVRML